jgi:alkanesulfonate monooxygenase SsuD/methylene tetrahydromethanopterin reductase-like flavin-dependent oxidoreductase (luciferase family)
MAQGMVAQGRFPAGLDAEGYLQRLHAFYGHPEEVAEALAAERVLPVATDLLAQFNPGLPTQAAALHALELIATEVAPALGWSPVTEPAVAV